jgi:hypothetical protein
MNIESSFIKDPSSVLDYKFDWRAQSNSLLLTPPVYDPELEDWLQPGEIINSFTITAGSGITVLSSYKSDGDTSVTVWLSGGKVFIDYPITCHIVTSASPIAREDNRTMVIQVRTL